MQKNHADLVREKVRERYGQIAEQPAQGCASACCGTREPASSALKLGYSRLDLEAVPDGANLGLGCGNPQALANLKPGEVVLDLGSGAGLDVFLAAKAVGPKGKAIGVDMTPDMLTKARANLARSPYTNVEFRLGEIEHLPIADASIDVIISNCVINLSPDKSQVFREAFRVLKKGGRLAIADMIGLQALPEKLREDWSLYPGCIAGAATREVLETSLRAAGFERIRIEPKDESARIVDGWLEDRPLDAYLTSANIEAIKPE